MFTKEPKSKVLREIKLIIIIFWIFTKLSSSNQNFIIVFLCSEPESQINEPKTYLVETKEEEKGSTPG